jgi:hypothetical protein
VGWLSHFWHRTDFQKCDSVGLNLESHFRAVQSVGWFPGQHKNFLFIPLVNEHHPQSQQAHHSDIVWTQSLETFIQPQCEWPSSIARCASRSLFQWKRDCLHKYAAALTTPTSKLGVRRAMNKRLLIELLTLFENEPLVFEWLILPFALSKCGLCLWEKCSNENHLRRSSDGIVKWAEESLTTLSTFSLFLIE